MPDGIDFDIGRLEIAMDDALDVRGFQCLGNLPRDRQRLVQGHRARGESLGKGRSLDELHDQRANAGLPRAGRGLFETVDVGDVGMIQGGQELRLTFEPREAFGIGGKQVWQDLDRDVAIQFPVARAIHLSHPALAELG